MGLPTAEAPPASGPTRIERDKLLARIAFEVIWEHDLEAGTLRWTGLSLFGYPPEEASDDFSWWAARLHPDDHERVLSQVHEAWGGSGARWSSDYRFRRADGSWASVAARGVIERNREGRAVFVLGVMIDVSRAKEAEDRLRDTQRVLREALRVGQVHAWEEDLRAGVVRMDVAGLGGETHQAYEARPRGEAFRVLHPDDLPRLMALRQRTIETGGAFETEHRAVLPDGRERVILLRGKLVQDSAGKPERIVGTSLDITERKRTEEALRKSEALLREAEAFGQTGSWEFDLVSGEVYNSRGNRRIFFGDECSSSGTRVEDFCAICHPDDRDRLLRRHKELREQGAVGEIEYRTIRPDGSVRWILGRVGYVREESGKPVRAFGTNTDVTERKLAGVELERRLLQHAAVAQLGQSALNGGELQPLFEEAVGLVARSSGFDFAEVSELMSDQTSLLRASHGWDEHVRKETRCTVAPIILEQGVVSHAIVEISGVDQPFGILGAGTRTPRVFTENDLSFLQSIANVLASAVERERASRQLREQREQTQALSRKLITAQEAERRAVARELHDDFGQVLTAIKLNLQRRECDDGESIALVDGAIVRMRELARDLRPPLLDEFGLESSLRWYFEREARRAGLELRLELGPLLVRPSLEVETSCFRVAQEALTNIVRHAQAHRVALELCAAGPNLFLEVRDDGQGFDVPEARKRALRGYNQGLLSMQERVALASGELQIESTPGQGTTLRACLPLGHRGPLDQVPLD